MVSNRDDTRRSARNYYWSRNDLVPTVILKIVPSVYFLHTYHVNMVRGRKKDLTVPPTRQLTLQRDYRARKAQYLFELEQRCLRAEEENTRLRRELEQARAAMPFASPHEVVCFPCLAFSLKQPNGQSLSRCRCRPNYCIT